MPPPLPIQSPACIRSSTLSAHLRPLPIIIVTTRSVLYACFPSSSFPSEAHCPFSTASAHERHHPGT